MRCCETLLIMILLCSVGAGSAQLVDIPAGDVAKSPGKNIARGCPVTFDPQPNYGLCTDEGDAVQLTDGEYTANGFWVRTSTVGWAHVSPVVITIELGKVQPMAGMLAVKVRAYPPDRRKRDIDNIQKPLLDALEKGKAFYNDCQIKHLTTVMKESVRGGKTLVTIRSIENCMKTVQVKYKELSRC